MKEKILLVMLGVIIASSLAYSANSTEEICMIQVMAYAVDPNGTCQSVSPCDPLPAGWKKVDVCPSSGGSSSSSSSGGGGASGSTSSSTSIIRSVEESQNVTMGGGYATYETRPITEERMREIEEERRREEENIPDRPYEPPTAYAGGGAGGFSYSFSISSHDSGDIRETEGANFSITNVTRNENSLVLDAKVRSEETSKDMKIEKTQDSVRITSQEVSAVSKIPLKITDDGLYTDDGNSDKIRILPDGASDAVKKNLGASAEKITIESENLNAVYNIEAKKEKKFLGLIPLKVSYEVKVDASDASIVSVKKPWWDFLAV